MLNLGAVKCVFLVTGLWFKKHIGVVSCAEVSFDP